MYEYVMDTLKQIYKSFNLRTSIYDNRRCPGVLPYQVIFTELQKVIISTDTSSDTGNDIEAAVHLLFEFFTVMQGTDITVQEFCPLMLAHAH